MMEHSSTIRELVDELVSEGHGQAIADARKSVRSWVHGHKRSIALTALRRRLLVSASVPISSFGFAQAVQRYLAEKAAAFSAEESA